jgi:hypothetical protein
MDKVRQALAVHHANLLDRPYKCPTNPAHGEQYPKTYEKAMTFDIVWLACGDIAYAPHPNGYNDWPSPEQWAEEHPQIEGQNGNR